MPIPDLFSRRRRAERGEVPDVYQYDDLPMPFRVQVWHIITDALGENDYGYTIVEDLHKHVGKVLIREYGLMEISRKHRDGPQAMHEFFLHNTDSIEQALDVIEFYFRLIADFVGTSDYRNKTHGHSLTAKQAVDDLNQRFREAGIGYQFESGKLIRLDSAFLHAEAVKPVLSLLRDSQFAGANDEFIDAHEHYRHGRYEECLVSCGKAFESTMITICTIRKWEFKSKDNASTLINICFENGLIPTYLDNQMAALRTLLASGVPTMRNKDGGHGQGVKQRVVPEFLARYALNLTASTILFLVDSNNSAIQA